MWNYPFSSGVFFSKPGYVFCVLASRHNFYFSISPWSSRVWWSYPILAGSSRVFPLGPAGKKRGLCFDPGKGQTREAYFSFVRFVSLERILNKVQTQTEKYFSFYVVFSLFWVISFRSFVTTMRWPCAHWAASTESRNNRGTSTEGHELPVEIICRPTSIP